MNFAFAGCPIVGAVQEQESKRNPLIELLIRIARTLNEKGDPL